MICPMICPMICSGFPACFPMFFFRSRQECRAHATQQLDIALASLREPLGPPGPADEQEEDDFFGFLWWFMEVEHGLTIKNGWSMELWFMEVQPWICFFFCRLKLWKMADLWWWIGGLMICERSSTWFLGCLFWRFSFFSQANTQKNDDFLWGEDQYEWRFHALNFVGLAWTAHFMVTLSWSDVMFFLQFRMDALGSFSSQEAPKFFLDLYHF